MQSIHNMPRTSRQLITYVLTDIDDTLTNAGQLPAIAYKAMERLQKASIKVVPVTGRPAGWCDHIARMWPVAGVIGENGAFYFYYDHRSKKMVRRFWHSAEQREENRSKLVQLKNSILKQIPGCAVSADQPYREADLSIDFSEDVPPLPLQEVKRIVEICEQAGAVARISSIHVNTWFGEYDKLAMSKRFFAEVFALDLDDCKEMVVFSGDSPNDGPMFNYFPHAVGVANVLQFINELPSQPAWATENKGGYGFAEMGDVLLSER